MSKVTLAHPFDPKKVNYPCIAQPKLDGIRCRAVVVDGVVTLWTRDDKPILSMDHIIIELSSLPNVELDGELYEHSLPFEEISGICRRQYHNQDSLKIKYVVYDYIPSTLSDSYLTRYNYLNSLGLDGSKQYLSLLPVTSIPDYTQLKVFHQENLIAGYEGTMIRTDVFDKKLKIWSDPGYQSKQLTSHRRSWSLLKMKDFLDGEYLITGLAEEISIEGIPKSRTGAFILSTKEGSAFQASGISDIIKQDSWQNRDKYIGKYATIKYFEISSDGIPRFPNFVDVRWDVSPA